MQSMKYHMISHCCHEEIPNARASEKWPFAVEFQPSILTIIMVNCSRYRAPSCPDASRLTPDALARQRSYMRLPDPSLPNMST
jgi:hypothetical protein